MKNLFSVLFAGAKILSCSAFLILIGSPASEAMAQPVSEIQVIKSWVHLTLIDSDGVTRDQDLHALSVTKKDGSSAYLLSRGSLTNEAVESISIDEEYVVFPKLDCEVDIVDGEKIYPANPRCYDGRIPRKVIDGQYSRDDIFKIHYTIGGRFKDWAEYKRVNLGQDEFQPSFDLKLVTRPRGIDLDDTACSQQKTLVVRGDGFELRLGYVLVVSGGHSRYHSGIVTCSLVSTLTTQHARPQTIKEISVAPILPNIPRKGFLIDSSLALNQEQSNAVWSFLKMSKYVGDPNFEITRPGSNGISCRSKDECAFIATETIPQ